MNKKMKTFALLLLCVTMASVVFAAEGHIDINSNVDATYYSDTSEVGLSGYCFSIDYNDTEYYLDDAGFELLLSDNNGDNNNNLEDYNNQLSEEGVESFSMQWNDTNFSFDYEDGQTVGNDTNANVITHIYNSQGNDVLNTAPNDDSATNDSSSTDDNQDDTSNDTETDEEISF